MALVGISRTDTFEYVSNDDPCKRRVPKMLPGLASSLAVMMTGEDVVIDDGATLFRLGVLDVFLMGMIYDKSTKISRSLDDGGDVSMHTSINATNIETVRYGLRGWEHFRDPNGSDIAFQTEKRIVMGRDYLACTDDMLQLLGVRLIGELAGKIKEASEVSKDEAKNSVSAS
jgi:hypothetical protein